MNDGLKGPLGFGGRLKTLRTARKLLAVDLARQLGCTQAAVSGWECGEYYPGFWNLVEISKFFGVDMDWLTGMPYVRNELHEQRKVREQLKEKAA